jgi:hypothetical protein
MPTICITTRHRKYGDRYVVRYRLGGRTTPVTHAGTFTTYDEAAQRKVLIQSMLERGWEPTKADRC